MFYVIPEIFNRESRKKGQADNSSFPSPSLGEGRVRGLRVSKALLKAEEFSHLI